MVEDIQFAKNKEIADIQKGIVDTTLQRTWFGKTLTVKMLKEMKNHEFFAWGLTNIEHPWFNDANNVGEDGRSTIVKWVAVRGNGFHDWAIFHSMNANLVGEEGFINFNGTTHLLRTLDQIADHGSKLYKKDLIKFLVPCTPTAFKLYRT